MMNGLVLLVMLSIAPTREIAPASTVGVIGEFFSPQRGEKNLPLPPRLEADTSIYIENVLWPHAVRNAQPVNEPRSAPRSEKARKSRGARRP